MICDFLFGWRMGEAPIAVLVRSSSFMVLLRTTYYQLPTHHGQLKCFCPSENSKDIEWSSSLR